MTATQYSRLTPGITRRAYNASTLQVLRMTSKLTRGRVHAVVRFPSPGFSNHPPEGDQFEKLLAANNTKMIIPNTKETAATHAPKRKSQSRLVGFPIM